MNKNYEERDKIIFGSYEPDKYWGGCRRFSCTRDVIQELLDGDYIDPEECQNYSPYVKEFMESTEGMDNVTFNCYAISPDRGDYRVTIEGVDIELSDTDYDTITQAVESFHYADEFGFEHCGDVYHLHAWWD